MPNTFAYIVLYGWPVVVFFLFRAMPRAEALIWSILGGYLLLPFGIGINPPVLPTFDKVLIPALSAGIMCLVTPERPGRLRRTGALLAERPVAAAEVQVPVAARGRAYTRQSGPNLERTRAVAAAVAPEAVPAEENRPGWGWLFNLLLLLLVVSPFLTVLRNTEPVVVGPRVIRGLRLYDGFSMVLSNLVSILPFLLGRRYLAGLREQALLLRLLCVTGLLYTLPTLFEIHMSPQLSRWIYGYLAQSFLQAARDGGWRPVVFLQQGLWLAIFMAMVALAGFALWRHERARGLRTRWVLAGAYLAVVLVFCHSLGALMILIVLAPVVLLASTRVQLIMASVVAASIVTYPVLRGAGVVPVDAIYQFTNSSISTARAGSFYFRLKNEDQLLARANQKPIVGWGSYGRQRVYDSQGRDISVTDGVWIVFIGVFGWLGYIAIFGLLTAPILLLALRQRRLEPSLATSGLCLVLAANLIDMIMNGTLTPVTWLVAGALAGRLTLPVAAGHLAEEPGQARRRRAPGRAVRRGRGNDAFLQSGGRWPDGSPAARCFPVTVRARTFCAGERPL